MFRKRGFNPNDEIFLNGQNKIKNRINENLSHIVKELQKEFKPANLLAQSDSSLVQHFCICLEAAFIHGLKFQYYEKTKSNRAGNSLPSPCFWNILQKISHSETIKQVDDLKYISTRVGKCRAWLRLTLNEGAINSYLNSLFSKEYRKVVSYYYERHALFLDEEKVDIFFQYLQGVESIQFDTSFNSSVLNQWTKTPIELAGLIPPSTSVPLYNGLHARIDNNNHSPSIRPHRNTNSLTSHHGMSTLEESVQRKLLDKSIEEKLQLIKERSTSSTSTDHSRSTIDADIENTEPDKPEDNAPILHTRQLMKKRKKRRKLQRTVRSSWSSLSSAESSGNSYTSCNNTPRSSSICSTPPQMVLRKNHANMEVLPQGNLQGKHKFKSRSNSSDSFKNLDETNEHEKTKDEESVAKAEESKHSIEISTNVTEQLHSEALPSNLEDSTSSQISTNKIEKKLNEQMELQGAYKLSYVTSSSDEEAKKNLRHDSSAIDIYETPPRKNNDTEHNMHRSISRSGNSLLHGTGWSSEITHSANSRKTSVSSLHSNTSTSYSLQSNLDKKSEDEEIFIRREGYLKKMGEKLKLWKKRWFKLRGKSLVYYKDKSATDILGSINLSDVGKVTEETNEKGEFYICLHGNDGKEYKLSDDNKNYLLDWKKDFVEVIVGTSSENESATKQTDAPLSYVDEYEVISELFMFAERTSGFCQATGMSKKSKYCNLVRSHLLNNVSTSWHAMMLSHMTKIAQEKGLDTQNYQCADCASPIGIIYGRPRLCTFTGQNYCSQCHLNEESMIPARIIHNGDFRKHKVAKRSKIFLDQIHADPVINLKDANPVIYRYIDEMGKLLAMRTRLMHIKPYLQTCKSIHPDEIFTRLKTRLHFLEDIHLYSVRDLCQVMDKELSSVLTKIISYGTKHIFNCSLCTAKGFLCEICHKDEIIFPFQSDTTVQCKECQALFHKLCKFESIKCPKCERREMRCLKSMQIQDDYLSDDSEKTDVESDDGFQ